MFGIESRQPESYTSTKKEHCIYLLKHLETVLSYLGGAIDETQHCFAGVEISTFVVLLCILLTLFSVSLGFVPRLVVIWIRNQNESLGNDIRMHGYLHECQRQCERVQRRVIGSRSYLDV